jgi:hypothetical protein
MALTFITRHPSRWLVVAILVLALLISACQDPTGDDLTPSADVTGTLSIVEAYPIPSGTPAPYEPPATESSGTEPGYPAPQKTPSADPYPVAGTPSTTEPAPVTRRYSVEAYLPHINGPPIPTATPTPEPTATPSPTPTPTIDFRAVRTQLQAEGQELGFASAFILV